MANSPELEKRICVVWNTERPFKDRPRESSNFTLLGFEWNLRMVYSVFRYYISLQEASGTEASEELISAESMCGQEGGMEPLFHVTTFIEDKKFHDIFKLGRTAGVNIAGVKIAPKIICEFSEDIVSTNILHFANYGEWRIVCQFHDVQPSMVQLKNETVHISTQTDLVTNLDYLSLDLGKLLEQETFPDVKIRCGGRIFSSHRSILAARSQVFAAMFLSKMEESETNIIDITDLDASVLDLLLRYAYTGRITDLSEDMAASLYQAGHSYDIYSLMQRCSIWMMKNLTEENCIDFLIVADAHEDCSFKDSVVSFICGHEVLLESEDWLRFSGEHPKLANEVYQRALRAKRKKL